jgi:hypothetical protein
MRRAIPFGGTIGFKPHRRRKNCTGGRKEGPSLGISALARQANIRLSAVLTVSLAKAISLESYPHDWL